jgi:hypothetical protein
MEEGNMRYFLSKPCKTSMQEKWSRLYLRNEQGQECGVLTGPVYQGAMDLFHASPGRSLYASKL